MIVSDQDYQFALPLKVRDYECDLQGIVNNAVYQNYLEHTRHEFLLSKDVDFAQLAREGVNLVVTRVELDYKASLSSGDEFWVGLNLVRQGRLRFEFHQDVYRARDQKLALRGRVTGVAVNAQGKPFFPEALAALIQD